MPTTGRSHRLNAQKPARTSLLAIAFAGVVLLGWGMPASVAGDSGLIFQEGDIVGSIDLKLTPDAGTWKTNQAMAPGKTVESSAGYRLRLERETAGEHALWSIHLDRADGQAFAIADYAWECAVPLGAVATVFDTQAHAATSLFRQAPQLDAAIDVRPNQGVPFMMACDHYGNNSLAVGPMDQTGTYRITGRRVGEQYSIRFDRREYAGDGWWTGTNFTDAWFASSHQEFWYDAARAYADAVDRAAGYAPLPTPAKADLPYYSTWYAFSEKIDEQIIREQALVAKELGIGSFLIFIGWGECENWFSSENRWGDYTACESRFKDFAGLVRFLQQECEMAVQVWVAPTWIGSGSQSFARMKDYRSKWPEGDYDRNLDPRSPAVREHIRDKFAMLAKTYGLDGFYVDFADTIYNRNDAPHAKEPALFGAGYEKFLESLWTGFAAEQPAGLAEYRQPFANLLSKRYATIFNTTYTTGDWQSGRIMAMMMRPFSQGVLTRCDPLIFEQKQLHHRDALGKALSAMMLLGPPGLSMDLTQLDAGQRKYFKAWFDWYRAHRVELVGGQFRPFGEQYHIPEMMVSHGDTAFAWVSRWQTGAIPFPEGTTHAFIFTCLPEEVSYIARVNLTAVTGLKPGQYQARWMDSSMESHDGWFEITYDPRFCPQGPQPLKSPRENWDFAPDPAQGLPSLDIRRGGHLELKWQAPLADAS